jgi:N(2)-fixation sustaining protein CowN
MPDSLSPVELRCSCGEEHAQRPDRYVSFAGIDCDGNARRLVDMLRPHMNDPARRNPFWELFEKKLAAESEPRHDELFLIHAHINILRDFLEQYEDREALTLLEQIEEECC